MSLGGRLGSDWRRRGGLSNIRGRQLWATLRFGRRSRWRNLAGSNWFEICLLNLILFGRRQEQVCKPRQRHCRQCTSDNQLAFREAHVLFSQAICSHLTLRCAELTVNLAQMACLRTYTLV